MVQADEIIINGLAKSLKILNICIQGNCAINNLVYRKQYSISDNSIVKKILNMKEKGE